jgi:hypothetical protein
MTAYLKHTDIDNDGIQPAQYVLRDIFVACCFHFDRGLDLERFGFNLPVKTFLKFCLCRYPCQLVFSIVFVSLYLI